jgi:hypothetical protein
VVKANIKRWTVAGGVAGAPPSIGGWVGLGIGGSNSCETGLERLGEVRVSGVAGAPPSMAALRPLKPPRPRSWVEDPRRGGCPTPFLPSPFCLLPSALKLNRRSGVDCVD